MKALTMPAGRYYLGDPSHCFHAPTWAALCADLDRSPMVFVRELPVLAFRTRYGDGIYSDNRHHEYAVDSGRLGLVPEAAIEDRHELRDFGRFVVFYRPVLCRAGDGLLVFGRRVIDTRAP